MPKRGRKHYQFRTTYGAVLSARMLALQAGVSTVTMSRILQGHNAPSMNTLTKLAHVLGVTPTRVYSMVVPPSKQPHLAA